MILSNASAPGDAFLLALVVVGPVGRSRVNKQQQNLKEQLSGVRLLVFDWDGTLEDSTATIVDAIEHALISVGKTPPSRSEMRGIIGLNAVEGLAALYPGEDARQLAKACARATRTAPHRSQLYPEVPNTLQRLVDAGFWLAVATGKPRVGLDHALKHHSLEPLFLTTRTADDAPSKPHPAMLESILLELGVEPDEALMIGDTTYDLQMASNAGVASLGVSCGSHTGHTLQSTGMALQIFDGVHELVDLFIDHQ